MIPAYKPSPRRVVAPPLNLSVGTGTLPSPAVLGVLGDRFNAWRAGQEAAIMTSIDAETRCVIECLPTGAGKTLIYIAEAVLNGGKVVIATSTKGQQDQIVDSVRAMIDAKLIADVRGQMNYRCEAVMPGGEHEAEGRGGEFVPVADGPCHDGAVCSLRDGGCGYYDAIRAAQRAPINIVNYAFWFTNARVAPENKINDRPVDLLVCDEAHDLINAVCDFLSTEVTHEDEKAVVKLGMVVPTVGDGTTIGDWQSWAAAVCSRIEMVIEAKQGTDQRERRKLRRLGAKLDKLRYADTTNWVWDVPISQEHVNNKTIIRFDPIWPLKYAEQVLFRGAKKIIMSSATVRMKTAELMGLSDADVTMFEMPSAFAVKRRPIYHIPTMQMNYRNEQKEGSEKVWVSMCERIADARRHQQGIIHTTSYKRRNQLVMSGRDQAMRLNSFSSRLVSHSTLDARSVIEQFKSSWGLRREAPARVLVSPSVTTGYDFADDAARWQIIVKLPILDTRAKVMKARCKEDVEYGPYHTATTIMQATGRVVRSEQDYGETFIIDDNIVWFIRRWGQKLFAQWWLDAYNDWGETNSWKMFEALPGLLSEAMFDPDNDDIPF